MGCGFSDSYLTTDNGCFSVSYLTTNNGCFSDSYLTTNNGCFSDSYLTTNNGCLSDSYLTTNNGCFSDSYLTTNNGCFSDSYLTPSHKVYRVTSTLPVEDLETLSLRSELTAVGPDPAIKQVQRMSNYRQGTGVREHPLIIGPADNQISVMFEPAKDIKSLKTDARVWRRSV